MDSNQQHVAESTAMSTMTPGDQTAGKEPVHQSGGAGAITRDRIPVVDFQNSCGFEWSTCHPPTNLPLYASKARAPVGLVIYAPGEFQTVLRKIEGAGWAHNLAEKGISEIKGMKKSNDLEEFEAQIEDGGAHLTDDEIWMIRYGACGYPLFAWCQSNCVDSPLQSPRVRMHYWQELGIAISPPQSNQSVKGIYHAARLPKPPEFKVLEMI